MRETENDAGERVLVPATWKPPSHTVLPELLEQGRQAIAELLKPAGADGVSSVMMPLMLTQQIPATEGMGDSNAERFFAAMAGEYQRHLAEIPLDILKLAADACAKESSFFPQVADFWKHARPKLEERKRQQWRIDRLIEEKRKPAKAEPPPQEPLEQRLRASIWLGWKHGRLDLAQRAERELAKLENRAPAEWATPQIVMPPMPPARRTTARQQEQFITDVPIGQEEPPLPTEIPE